MSTISSIISIDFHFSGLVWKLRCSWWEVIGIKRSPFWPFTLIVNIYIALGTQLLPETLLKRESAIIFLNLTQNFLFQNQEKGCNDFTQGIDEVVYFYMVSNLKTGGESGFCF